MYNTPKSNSSFKNLAANFEKKYKDLRSEFEEKHADSLVWLKDKGIDVENLPKQARKTFAAGAAAGVMLLSSGIAPTKELPSVFQQKELPGRVDDEIGTSRDKTLEIKKDLDGKLPLGVGPLSSQREKEIAEALSKTLGFKVTPELQGFRLNTSYGYIGTESHLYRFPGDNMSTHFDSPEAVLNYGGTGMAGGPGAYGYVARNRQSLTTEMVQMEKYYVVVQTFDSPSWKKKGAYQWFKHRKFLVVNPHNGKAVVGVLMDAGPSKAGGKQYGGSPEIMDSLGLYPPKSRTGVLFFFIDEANGKVTLGPK